jgi:hypothetical protein
MWIKSNSSYIVFRTEPISQLFSFFETFLDLIHPARINTFQASLKANNFQHFSTYYALPFSLESRFSGSKQTERLSLPIELTIASVFGNMLSLACCCIYIYWYECSIELLPNPIHFQGLCEINASQFSESDFPDSVNKVEDSLVVPCACLPSGLGVV